ncbi:MAG: glycosyltransferase family 4 protein [Chryseotalea sp. WA131a]|jgi:colanic acid biosynthesis glycosyl transferase WcaI|nr:MAG: glycosyltransferase family 4 protein [Chryseotalea sp. WA131a]
MAAKILYISQYYDPEQPSVRWQSLTEGLVKRGYEVQVLTSFPSYPHGRVFPGYKTKLFQRDTLNGVEILRVPSFPSKDKSIVKRMITYLSFSISACLIGIFVVRRPAVIMAYHPPATVSIPVLFFKTIYRIPATYDIQDMWPDTLFHSGVMSENWVSRAIGGYMKVVYKSVNHLSVITEGFFAQLVERGVSPAKMSVIHNWAIDTGDGLIDESVTDRFKERTTILFAGTMGKAQSLNAVVDAFERFQQLGYPKDTLGLYFLGMGTERDELASRCENKNIENVYFWDLVPPNQVKSYLLAADVLLVHLKNSPLFKITVPGKFQTYCSMGKPILSGVGGEVERMVKNSNCGWTFEPENVDELCECFVKIVGCPVEEFSTKGEAAKLLYATTFEKEAAIDRFDDALRQLIK